MKPARLHSAREYTPKPEDTWCLVRTEIDAQPTNSSEKTASRRPGSCEAAVDGDQLRSLGVLLRPWQAFRQPFDLAIMVRLVLADVKPLAVAVGRAPGPALVHRHQPAVVPFLEFGQGALAGFAEDIR